MQDQVRAYSPDCAAPSDHSPRRELAPHPPGYHPYSEMGYQDLGRNPSRLRKEIIEIYCKRMASAGAEAIPILNLTNQYKFIEEEQTDASDNTLSPHSNGNKAKYLFLQEYEPPSHYARTSLRHHDFYSRRIQVGH